MMSTSTVYLRPDVAAIPLVSRWAAYEMMIAPHLLAMVIKGQLDLLASYVRFPAHHLKARADPALVGGPWVDYPTDRSREAAALRDEMARRCAPLLELAAAIRQLDELLGAEAVGGALKPLYARVPDPLRGYVELVYDLRHRPAVRFLEGLLYRSRYYDRGLQSLALSRLSGDRRPFVWATPVFDERDQIIAPLAFDDPAVDAVLGAISHPRPLGELAERLAIGDDRRDALARLVTTEPPRRGSRPERGIRVRYMGHACVLVETRDLAILVDPFLGYDVASSVPRYTALDLPPRIDVVLITHGHNDHLELETLLRLRHRIGTILVPRASGRSLQDPSLKLLLRAVGFPDVHELGELESYDVPGGRVVSLPFLGEHCDLDIQGKCAWRVELGERSIVFAADSANIEPRLYDHLRRLFGGVDILFLGMECDGGPLSWAYGKIVAQPLGRELDRSRTVSGSDYAEARAMLEVLQPGRFYVYAMGAEPWLHHVMVIPDRPDSPRVRDPRRLVADYRSRCVEAEQLVGRKEILLDVE